MSRHAYLIMAHHQFDFLKELLLALDDTRNDIYLHIDQKVSAFDVNEFSSLLKHSRLYVTPRRLSIHWGGFSQIAGELLLLETAAPGHYAYYHLLSGADFPLKSQDEIHRFFEAHKGREFLEFDSREVPKNVRERISLYHFFRESASPLAEPADMILTRIQRLLRVDRLKNRDWKIQKGPNWFSITDAFAQYVLSHREWLPSFERSVCADELFLQTLAINSDFMERVFDPFGEKGLGNLRYVDWKRGTQNSPYVFQKADREMLLGLPHLFARKFEENIFAEENLP